MENLGVQGDGKQHRHTLNEDLDAEVAHRLSRQRTGVRVDIDTLKKGLVERTWNSMRRAWRLFVTSTADRVLSARAIVEHIATICNSEKHTRPQNAVDKLRHVVGYVCAIDDEPNPMANRLIMRVIDAMVRTGTSRDANQGTLLDTHKVLRYLRAHSRRGHIARQDAMAAFASIVPSRPNELANLRAENVTIEFEEQQLGRPNETFAAHELPFERHPTIGRPYPAFAISVHLSHTKTDKQKRRGIRKLIQHPAGEPWSPALLLLCYWTTHRRTMAFPRDDRLDDRPLSPDTVSHDLANVSIRATGLRVTGKWWRHAAATWLLRNGLDIETVTALGGWANPDALRKFYVRAVRLDDTTMRRVAGLELPALATLASRPPLRAPAGAPEMDDDLDVAASAAAAAAAAATPRWDDDSLDEMSPAQRRVLAGAAWSRSPRSPPTRRLTAERSEFEERTAKSLWLLDQATVTPPRPPPALTPSKPKRGGRAGEVFGRR